MKPAAYVWMIHLTGWIAFIVLPLVLFPVPPLFDQGRLNHFLVDFMSANVILIGTFYLNYLLGVPKYLLRRRVPEFILLNIGAFALLALLRWALQPGPMPGPPVAGRPPDAAFMNGATVFRFIVVVLMAIGFRVYEAWRNAQEATVKAEISYLKAQINPHFLFNTLNGLYSLAIKGSDQTPDAILRLSSIMRYVLLEAEHPQVPLAKEIQYLKDYVALQQMRLPFGMQLDLKFPDSPSNVQIAPLLLVSFVENAFKYGVSAEHPSTIRIHLTFQEGKLIMQVENHVFKTTAPADPDGGIGMTNTRKRLQLLYPGRHELLVQDTGSTYLVGLTLQLA